jgi:hypothetical protein
LTATAPNCPSATSCDGQWANEAACSSGHSHAGWRAQPTKRSGTAKRLPTIHIKNRTGRRSANSTSRVVGPTPSRPGSIRLTTPCPWASTPAGPRLARDRTL